jgi:hypothetical protein
MLLPANDTFALLADQVPPAGVDDTGVVLPKHNDAAPVIALGGGNTLINAVRAQPFAKV